MARPYGEAVLDALRARAQRVVAGADTTAETPFRPSSVDDVWDLLTALFRYSVDGIAITHRETRTFVEVSDSLCTMTGYRRRDLLGRTPDALGLVDATGVTAVARHNAERGLDGVYEGTLRCRDGRLRQIEFSQQMLGEHYMVTIVRDVTRRRQLETQLRHLAATDPLTGLLNRRRFNEEVSRVIGESARFGEPVTLVIIDLDGLKAINDRYGHPAGDAALRALADTITGEIRDIDIAGRLGGDEFAVLLTRADEQGAARLIAAMHDHLKDLAVDVGADQPVQITASVGAATDYPPLSLDRLLAAADQAMYRNKGRRRPTPDTR